MKLPLLGQDDGYQTVAIVHSGQVEFAQPVAWLTGVRPSLGGVPGKLFGLRAMAAEVIIDERGIRHRLRVPRSKAGAILGQLEAHLPGTHVVLEDQPPSPQWTYGREYGTTDTAGLLAVGHPEDVVKTLLSVGRDLGAGETLMYQFVFTAAIAKPNAPSGDGSLLRLLGLLLRGVVRGIAADRTTRAEEPTFLGVVRTAVCVASPSRAVQLLSEMQDALGSLHTNRAQFRRLPRYPYILRRIRSASVPLLLPADFALSEAATLLAVPLRSPDIPGLPRARTRHLRPDPAISKRGIVLARSTIKNQPLALLPEDFMTHLYLPGKTGTGKTTVEINIASQWLHLPEGHGLTFFDPHGDAAEQLLDLIPPHRVKDVIYLYPDLLCPVGVNPLRGNPSIIASFMMGVLEALFGVGILTADYLRSAIYTIALRGNMTLHEVVLVLDDPLFRDEVTRDLKDENLRRFWTAFEALSVGERTRTIEPVMRRLRPFLMPELRGIFGQAEGIDMRQVLDDGKILIVNLSQGQLGSGPAEMVGAMVVARLWQEVLSRSRTPESQRRPHLLVADEFQRLIRLPISFGDLLAEARKFRLGLVLANQLMEDIRDIRTNVLANTRSKLVLEVVAQDAAMLAREIGVREEDIKRLGKYEAILSLVRDGESLPPATGYTLPPAEPLGIANAVRAASRRQYGKPMAEVEREIEARRQFGQGSRKRPTVGEQDWE